MLGEIDFKLCCVVVADMKLLLKLAMLFLVAQLTLNCVFCAPWPFDDFPSDDDEGLDGERTPRPSGSAFSRPRKYFYRGGVGGFTRDHHGFVCPAFLPRDSISLQQIVWDP